MKLSINLLIRLEWASATGETLLCNPVKSLVHNDLYKWIMCLSFRVQAQDGGDPKVEASPRDIVYTELAQIVANTETQSIAQTHFRFGYVDNTATLLPICLTNALLKSMLSRWQKCSWTSTNNVRKIYLKPLIQLYCKIAINY